MIRLILALLVLLGAPAQAQLLRSGEHGTFTRLAFVGPASLDWQVERDGDTARIAFDPPLAFDTSAIWDRIARDRLRDVAMRDGDLRLELGCTCDVDIQRFAGGQIAIDIRPGDEAALSAADPPSPVRPAPDTAQPDRTQSNDVTAVTQLPLVLEPLALRLSPRLQRASTERAIGPRPGRATAAPAAAGGPPPGQIRIRDGRAADTIRSDPDPLPAVNPIGRCDGEDRLAEILLRDPSDAFGALADGIAALDRNAPDTVTAMRDTLFSATLATEAQHFADAHGVADRWTALLYAGSGEARRPAPMDLIPECGAAAGLLALASGGASPLVPATLRAEMLALAQDLPAMHRSDLVPRAADQARANRLTDLADALAALALAPAAESGPLLIEEYGEALSTELAGTTGQPAPSELMEEAAAVYRELPPSAARTQIERALVRDAARDGNAQGVLAGLETLDPAQRDAAMSQIANDILAESPAKAVVLATALAPLREAMPAAERARLARFLVDQGYAPLADRWQRARPSAPRLANEPAALTAGQPPASAPDSPRARLAVLSAEADGPGDVFTQASQRLARSREAARIATEILRQP